MKICKKCKIEKEFKEFSKRNSSKDGFRGSCKICRSKIAKNRYDRIPEIIKKKRQEYYQKNKEEFFHKTRKQHLKKKFNITIEDYKNLLDNQSNKCAICESNSAKNKLNKNFSVDHCHRSGKIRGLLCNKCNAGIGYFEDNVHFLKNAIKYLEKNK